MTKSGFNLHKWYLDFVSHNGEAMIFYAARMTYLNISVYYSSWLHYHPANGPKVRSHFRNVKLPLRDENTIFWHDDVFNVSGKWQSRATPLLARIFEDDHGYLDWNCFQPVSKVQLRIDDQIIDGRGYGEELVLTTLPWHIPMDELRWGRFHAPGEIMVWIELREKNKQQWLWLNGTKYSNCQITDDFIESAKNDFILKLDHEGVIESQKTIFKVVEKILRFIPGFKQLMPAKFLMARNNKWISTGEFQRKGRAVAQGMAIHECVNFNTHSE